MSLRGRLLIDAVLLMTGANVMLAIVRRDWWQLPAWALMTACWLWGSRARERALLQFVRWRQAREAAREHQQGH